MCKTSEVEGARSLSFKTEPVYIHLKIPSELEYKPNQTYDCPRLSLHRKESKAHQHSQYSADSSNAPPPS